MSNWQNINPPVTLSKPLTLPTTGSPPAHLERESPRPVIGMIPQSLRPKPRGLSPNLNTFPIPIDWHTPVAPSRTNRDLVPTAVAAETCPAGPPIPRVIIENYPRLPSQPLKTIEPQDPSIGRSHLEALNGRLVVRSLVDWQPHACRLDSTGARDIVVELRRQASIRDLLLLESGVRCVETGGLHPLTKASLLRANATPLHAAVRLPRLDVAPRLVGPKLSIPLPDIEQPK